MFGLNYLPFRLKFIKLLFITILLIFIFLLYYNVNFFKLFDLN